MLYCIFCYAREVAGLAMTTEQVTEVMGNIGAVCEKLTKEGKLGPAVRLAPTTAARTLRKDQDPPIVMDGPFAETKEQLLGFYIVRCASHDEAVEVARELGVAVPAGCYEVRPVETFDPGVDVT
jgi:hypothetical protein